MAHHNVDPEAASVVTLWIRHFQKPPTSCRVIPVKLRFDREVTMYNRLGGWVLDAFVLDTQGPQVFVMSEIAGWGREPADQGGAAPATPPVSADRSTAPETLKSLLDPHGPSK